MVRKYLYLITSHPKNGDLVGSAEVTDSPKYATAAKNEEGTCNIRNRETGETYEYQLVGMGYADFESEDDYEENIGGVIQEKLTEIDRDHLEKAGVDLQEVTA